MHPAQGPGLVLVALAVIAAACSPLSPTQTPAKGGMRTQSAGANIGLSLDQFPAPAASALAMIPRPPAGNAQPPQQTIPQGPPGVAVGPPAVQPPGYPSTPGAPQGSFPAVKPPNAPNVSLP